jgi:hypothetical protein
LNPSSTAIEEDRGVYHRPTKATPAEYRAGLNPAIQRGGLALDRAGTCVKFTQAGAELFA